MFLGYSLIEKLTHKTLKHFKEVVIRFDFRYFETCE